MNYTYIDAVSTFFIRVLVLAAMQPAKASFLGVVSSFSKQLLAATAAPRTSPDTTPRALSSFCFAHFQELL